LQLLSQSKKGEHKLSSGIVEAKPFAGDAVALARGSADEDIHISNCKRPGLVFGKGAEVWDIGPAMLEDCAGEGFDLCESDGFPPEGMPGNAGCFHT
jgi:hypothetical protein